MTNIYLELSDIGHLDVMCHLHGLIDCFTDLSYIQWQDLEEIADDHLHSMHFA